MWMNVQATLVLMEQFVKTQMEILLAWMVRIQLNQQLVQMIEKWNDNII